MVLQSKKWKWSTYKVREVDLCLYKFLITLFLLRLVSQKALENGSTCNTNLLDVEE
jgi:hypothetical protein